MEASDLSSVLVSNSSEMDFGPWMLVTLWRGCVREHGDSRNIGSHEAHVSDKGHPLKILIYLVPRLELLG